jgi:hypothetical protein
MKRKPSKLLVPSKESNKKHGKRCWPTLPATTRGTRFVQATAKEAGTTEPEQPLCIAANAPWRHPSLRASSTYLLHQRHLAEQQPSGAQAAQQLALVVPIGQHSGLEQYQPMAVAVPMAAVLLGDQDGRCSLMGQSQQCYQRGDAATRSASAGQRFKQAQAHKERLELLRGLTESGHLDGIDGDYGD